MLYTNLTYLLLGIFLIYKLTRKKFDLFQVLIFIMPFHSWYYNVGLNLTIYQIMIFVIWISLVISLTNEKIKAFNITNIPTAVFILFAIVNSSLMSIFVIDDFMNIEGFFRSNGRFIGQILFLLLLTSLYPIASIYIKNIKDIVKYLKMYLYGISVLSILGLIQLLVYYGSGVDIFPLRIDDDIIISSIHTADGISYFFRLSSLGGEPKGLSISLIFGFFIIHVFNKQGIFFFKHDQILKYIFITVASLTLSTSGIIMFIVLIFVYKIYILFSVKKYILLSSKSKKTVPLILMAFVGILLLFYWDLVFELITQRIIERNIISEDFDFAVQGFLIDFPNYLIFGSGLGNIHNLAYPYIPETSLRYMEGNIFQAKSGYLRLISELGVIGFFLFLGMVFNIYRKLNKINVSIYYKRNFNALKLLLVIATIAYLSRVYIVSEMFLILSIASAVSAIQINNKQTNK
jgi:hypothetical protein